MIKTKVCVKSPIFEKNVLFVFLNVTIGNMCLVNPCPKYFQAYIQKGPTIKASTKTAHNKVLLFFVKNFILNIISNKEY